MCGNVAQSHTYPNAKSDMHARVRRLGQFVFVSMWRAQGNKDGRRVKRRVFCVPTPLSCGRATRSSNWVSHDCRFFHTQREIVRRGRRAFHALMGGHMALARSDTISGHINPCCVVFVSDCVAFFTTRRAMGFFFRQLRGVLSRFVVVRVFSSGARSGVFSSEATVERFASTHSRNPRVHRRRHYNTHTLA